MLIGARTATWGGKALPYDYEVEWIKFASKGTRTTNPNSFDTGVPITNAIFDIDFSIADHMGVFDTNETSILVNDKSGGSLSVRCEIDFYGSWSLKNAIIDDLATAPTFSYDTKFNFKSTVADLISYTPSFTVRIPSKLKTTWNKLFDGYGGYARDVKIHRILITNSVTNEEILDAIPVSLNGVGFMYDKITSRLLENCGPDSPTPGPKI